MFRFLFSSSGLLFLELENVFVRGWRVERRCWCSRLNTVQQTGTNRSITRHRPKDCHRVPICVQWCSWWAGQDSRRRFRADVNTWWRETRRRRRRGARRRGDAARRLQSSSCFGPLNSSCEMKPFLSLSSCWKISSTSLSWSASIFFTSSLSPAPPCSASIICFLRYSLTCTDQHTVC